jgi:hypothetical protein
MTMVQIRGEIEPAGFRVREQLEFLPWQHIVVFEPTAR